LKVPAHKFHYDYSAAGVCSGTVAPYGHSNIIVRPTRDENVINTSRAYRLLTLRLLMSCIYGAPILDVSRSHTMTQHSR